MLRGNRPGSLSTAFTEILQPLDQQRLHIDKSADVSLGRFVPDFDESLGNVDIRPVQAADLFRSNPSEDAKQMVGQQFQIGFANRLEQCDDLIVRQGYPSHFDSLHVESNNGISRAPIVTDTKVEGSLEITQECVSNAG